MRNYQILFLSDANRITIAYCGKVYYRTLLQSLEDLLSITLLSRVQIILDFRETTDLIVSYRQIMNFHLALNALFSKKTIRKMAIINTQNATIHNNFCSPNQLLERDMLKYDMRAFNAEETVDAFKWLVL